MRPFCGWLGESWLRESWASRARVRYARVWGTKGNRMEFCFDMKIFFFQIHTFTGMFWKIRIKTRHFQAGSAFPSSSFSKSINPCWIIILLETETFQVFRKLHVINQNRQLLFWIIRGQKRHTWALDTDFKGGKHTSEYFLPSKSVQHAQVWRFCPQMS